MNTLLYDSPDSTGPNRWAWSPVVWPLMLSVLIHLILLMSLWERWDKGGSTSAARSEPVRHHFKLMPATPSARSASSGVAVEQKTQSAELASPQIPSQLKTINRSAGYEERAVRPVQKRATRKLDLSLPEAIASSVDTLPLKRSATVFDPQLTQAIKDAKSRPRGLSLAVSEELPAEAFVGGQWRSLTRIGDLCFEVIAADPLDSFGTDQWYRRSCD